MNAPPGAASAATRLPSLRRKLLLWLLLPLGAFVPLAAATMVAIATRPAIDSLDRSLRSTTIAFADLLVTHDGVVSLALTDQTARALTTDPYDTVAFAARDPDGRLLGGDAALAALSPPLADGQQLFLDAELGGRPIRISALGAACGTGGKAVCTILVAESVSKRAAARRAVLIGATLVALSMAAALVTLALIAVRTGLAPLNQLSAEIEKRSLVNLQPVDTAGVPLEAASLVNALNRLLERLRVAAGAQQKFLADAAHQLRTPLATLRAETELALLEPHPPQYAGQLKRLHAGAERAARLAHQLLALAAAENAAQAKHAKRVDLKALCTEVGEIWLGPALEAGIDLGFELEAAAVSGHDHLLRELLTNLLHNALEYAGRGASVTLRCGTRDGAAWLEVEDDGPGVPEADRARLWERFQRGSEARGSGSGLGLAIMRDIARAHGARASLESGAGGRGFRVRIVFATSAVPPPLPPAAQPLQSAA